MEFTDTFTAQADVMNYLGGAATMDPISASVSAARREVFNVSADIDEYSHNSSNLTADNRTAEQLLESYMGSRYRGLAASTILTIVYTAIFLTGVIGNVSTCIVIIKNTYMHTATNYYLFSLAISDVLTLILGLPPELYTIWEAYPWRLGTPYCLFKTFLTEMTSSASILTIAAFTVERYVAICHPIKAQTMSSLSRAVKIIVGIWVAAALSALPYPIHTRTYYYVRHPITDTPLLESFICNIRPEWMSRMRYFFQMSTFILFILPMGLITSLYVMIGLTLRRSGLARQTSASAGSPPHSQSRRTVLKMLVAVVVAFFICWAPFHAQRLMTVYISDEEWTPFLLEIQSMLFYISGVLYFISSTVNPILYNLMSKKYRQAFKDTLCRCFRPPSDPRNAGSRMRYGYERSTTYVTYANAPSSRCAAQKVNTQQCPLMKKNIPFSDASEDECKQLRGGYAYKNKNWQENRNSLRDQSCNGRTTAKVPVNGTVTSDCSPSGSQSSSPSAIAAHLREELEMTELHSQ